MGKLPELTRWQRSLVMELMLASFALLVIARYALSAEVAVPFPRVTATQVNANDVTARLKIPGPASRHSPDTLALPEIKCLIALPPGTDVRTLEVGLKDPVEEQLPGTYDITPASGRAKGRRATNSGDSARHEPDASLSASSVTLGPTSHIGRYLVVQITCRPYRYDPKTRMVTHVKSAKVVLRYATIEPPKDAPKTGTLPKLPKAEVRDFERVMKTVLNWAYVYNWYPLPGGENRTPNARGPRNALLILTTTDIQKASNKLAEFVTHKRKMGFAVDMVNESAWGSGWGANAAQRIRAYLKTVCKKYRYVLIIGDPRYESKTPMLKTNPYWFDYTGSADVSTDYYYADLTGNWDLNGNGVYAEWQGEAGLMDFGPGGVDLVPELIVGRIPYYGVSADLDKILAKIIRYETMPVVGAWTQRVLIPMKPFSESELSWNYGELIKNNIVLPASMGYFRIYDAAFDLVPTPEAYPCTSSAVLNEWKSGYGFVFWGTHGGGDGASSVFYSGQCPSLDDNMPAFVYAASCFNAHPETTTNLAYSLLLNGAIASVASTRMAGGGMEDGTIGIGVVYSKYLIGRRQRCGDAFWNAQTNLVLTQGLWNNHLSFVLYGDPTVAPRWPTTFSITTAPELRLGVVGSDYGQDLFAAGGKAPYRWSVVGGSLPPGLELKPNGSLSGIPIHAGSYTFDLQVESDSTRIQPISRRFTLRVDHPHTTQSPPAQQ